MKRTWFLIPAAALLLTTSLEAATDEKVAITGSHIPQKEKRVGYISSGMAPVLVIDRTAIEHSGASTVAGLLRMVPFAQVRGR